MKISPNRIGNYHFLLCYLYLAKSLERTNKNATLMVLRKYFYHMSFIVSFLQIQKKQGWQHIVAKLFGKTEDCLSKQNRQCEW